METLYVLLTVSVNLKALWKRKPSNSLEGKCSKICIHYPVAIEKYRKVLHWILSACKALFWVPECVQNEDVGEGVVSLAERKASRGLTLVSNTSLHSRPHGVNSSVSDFSSEKSRSVSRLSLRIFLP